ncbi:hypothetical protein [Brachybacterium sp. GPGPB12]|uniref:hypothetical protein n=1 Tax=Brachybacterium sp. GPGPB12 TaxID=3023517 RepID=UPI0031342A5B
MIDPARLGSRGASCPGPPAASRRARPGSRTGSAGPRRPACWAWASPAPGSAGPPARSSPGSPRTAPSRAPCPRRSSHDGRPAQVAPLAWTAANTPLALDALAA